MGPFRQTARLFGRTTLIGRFCVRNTCRLGLGSAIPATERDFECRTYSCNERSVNRIRRLNLVKTILKTYNRDFKKYLPEWYLCLDLKLSLYRAVDKSLARPGKKQVTAIGDFDVHILKGKAVPFTGLEWPRGFQEVKFPRFLDNGTKWW